MSNIKYTPGCFGKLPNFADFVKFNSGNNEILYFDKWLQNGLQSARTKLKDVFDTSYSNADPIHFVFPIPNSSNILLGTLISSSDKSGRKYPFIISTSINYSLEKQSVNLIPFLFQEFFSNSKTFLSSIHEKENLEEIILSVENHFATNETNSINKLAHYQEYTNATTFNKLWNRMFSNFDDDRKFLLMYNLTEILFPLRGKPLNNFSLGLNIPIENEEEFLYLNMSFWIDLCLKIINNYNILPYLFWPARSSNEEKNFTLFLTQPPPENYTQLIDPNYLMDNICLTEKEGQIESCMKFMNEKYKTLLSNKELTLTEFLKNI